MPWTLVSSPCSSTLENSLENWAPSATLGRGESPAADCDKHAVSCPPHPQHHRLHPPRFTLNVTHSASSTATPVGLCFHICLLPFRHKITTMITKVPLCPNPRLFHQRLSPEWGGPVLRVQPCPPGDWHRGRDSYRGVLICVFADDTVAHRRNMTCPGPSGSKLEE